MGSSPRKEVWLICAKHGEINLIQLQETLSNVKKVFGEKGRGIAD